MPRDLRKLAYREVGLLLAGAPLAEGYVLDRYHRWAPARIVRTATHLARSQPLGHLSQEILLCLVRADVLGYRTVSGLFIGTRWVAQGCSLEQYERVVNRALSVRFRSFTPRLPPRLHPQACWLPLRPLASTAVPISSLEDLEVKETFWKKRSS